MSLTTRRRLGPVLIVVMALGAALVTAPPASAAPAVSIRKIANKKVSYGKKATIRPAVRAASRTRVVSKRITVRRGSKTIARNRSSVRLGSGTYKLTTSVRFRVRSSKVVRSRQVRNVLTVPMYGQTPVTCVASNVRTEPETVFDLTCTGRAFDGAHRFLDVRPSGGVISEWNPESSWLTGTAVPPTEGTAMSLSLSPGFDLYQRRTVTVSRTITRWSGVKTTRRTQSLTITQRPRPKRADPYPSGECPSWAPIKGNGDSMIYHVPGGRWYDVTNAEECFATEGAARSAGYRASRNG